MTSDSEADINFIKVSRVHVSRENVISGHV